MEEGEVEGKRKTEKEKRRTNNDGLMHSKYIYVYMGIVMLKPLTV
jgi:hypothetical protein